MSWMPTTRRNSITGLFYPSRRPTCDGSIVPIVENARGEPLSVGRKTRTVPPALRRALHRRDKGCRFPGCEQTRHVDAHHIQHWAHGGETKLDNLVLLCRYHHRQLHEGGYTIERRGFEFYFNDPTGRHIPATPEDLRAGDVATLVKSVPAGTDLDTNSLIPACDSKRPDYQHIAWVLGQFVDSGDT
ncbi:MAG: HNH endonuclease signature motif containing protein [Gammaproteobacteria bacterium]|nr:HNH endonuclease signature motif containing protein [Gammaproteobacteria bacterium]